MDKWKVIAIVFICLFILSALTIISSLYYGIKETHREEVCALEKCSEYEFYSYSNNICYCFKEGKVVQTYVIS